MLTVFASLVLIIPLVKSEPQGSFCSSISETKCQNILVGGLVGFTVISVLIMGLLFYRCYGGTKSTNKLMRGTQRRDQQSSISSPLPSKSYPKEGKENTVVLGRKSLTSSFGCWESLSERESSLGSATLVQYQEHPKISSHPSSTPRGSYTAIDKLPHSACSSIDHRTYSKSSFASFSTFASSTASSQSHTSGIPAPYQIDFGQTFFDYPIAPPEEPVVALEPLSTTLDIIESLAEFPFPTHPIPTPDSTNVRKTLSRIASDPVLDKSNFGRSSVGAKMLAAARKNATEEDVGAVLVVRRRTLKKAKSLVGLEGLGGGRREERVEEMPRGRETYPKMVHKKSEPAPRMKHPPQAPMFEHFVSPPTPDNPRGEAAPWTSSLIYMTSSAASSTSSFNIAVESTPPKKRVPTRKETPIPASTPARSTSLVPPPVTAPDLPAFPSDAPTKAPVPARPPKSIQRKQPTPICPRSPAPPVSFKLPPPTTAPPALPSRRSVQAGPPPARPPKSLLRASRRRSNTYATDAEIKAMRSYVYGQ